jgi:hypothetical protein
MRDLPLRRVSNYRVADRHRRGGQDAPALNHGGSGRPSHQRAPRHAEAKRGRARATRMLRQGLSAAVPPDRYRQPFRGCEGGCRVRASSKTDVSTARSKQGHVLRKRRTAEGFVVALSGCSRYRRWSDGGRRSPAAAPSAAHPKGRGRSPNSGAATSIRDTRRTANPRFKGHVGRDACPFGAPTHVDRNRFAPKRGDLHNGRAPTRVTRPLASLASRGGPVTQQGLPESRWV